MYPNPMLLPGIIRPLGEFDNDYLLKKEVYIWFDLSCFDNEEVV